MHTGDKACPSDEVQQLIAQRWLDVCLPATNFHTYDEMRQAYATERQGTATCSMNT